jgi:tetratricopeptide (TPR) repeat protein
VAAAIEPQLYTAENFRSQRKPPESLDAWDCTIRALSDVQMGTRDGNTRAEALCRRAITIAPSYSQAHSLLAWVLMRRVLWASGYESTLPEAMAEAKAAISFDESDPWAHFTHGTVLWRLRRHGEAERAAHRAVELNPNFALAYCLLGFSVAVQGRHEEAIKSAEYALRLSPKDRLVGRYSAFAMMYAHFAAGRHHSTAWLASRLRDIRSTLLTPCSSRRPQFGRGGGTARRPNEVASPHTGFFAHLAARKFAVCRRVRPATH